MSNQENELCRGCGLKIWGIAYAEGELRYLQTHNEANCLASKLISCQTDLEEILAEINDGLGLTEKPSDKVRSR